MPISQPLGYSAARHVIELGRSAFFSGTNTDLPEAESPEIKSDDVVPQFGYVGSRYAKRRILFLGINPGNGPRAARNEGDAIQMPFWERFANAPTPQNFVQAQQAYKRACSSWFIWGRECNELLATSNLEVEDVAFSNALPWRTRSEAAFSRGVQRAAGQHYVRPLLSALRPRIVVAVGKTVQRIIEDAGSLSASLVVWNRARALTPTVRREREQASGVLRKLVST